MELAELLEREAVDDGDQILAWAQARSAALVEALDAGDPLAKLLHAGAAVELDADLEGVPVTRRRRREPSSPQPKTADELPPPPEHPGLAEGEPEPMLETVDTGPIDLEEEIVRRRMREDSWALATREVELVLEREVAKAEPVEVKAEPVEAKVEPVEAEPVEVAKVEPVEAEPVEAEVAKVEPAPAPEPEAAVAREIQPASEPSIEIDVDVDIDLAAEPAESVSTLEPSAVEPRAHAPTPTLEVDATAQEPEAPVDRPAQPSAPELPVVVGPAEPDHEVEAAGLEAAGLDIAAIDAGEEPSERAASDEEFEVDDLDELEVEEVELEDLDEEPEDEPKPPPPAAPPRPPPRKPGPPGPPPVRDEAADLISALVRTSESKTTRLDELDGAPAKPPEPEPDA